MSRRRKMTWHSSSFNGAAAFQPRKSAASVPPEPDKQELQWGRGFSAAEMPAEAFAATMADLLQWGRGFSAAEIPLVRRGYRAGRMRFNGAAAFQPRK